MIKNIGAVKRPILIKYKEKIFYVDKDDLWIYAGCKIIDNNPRVVTK